MDVEKKPSILVVASPSPLTSGGGLRALRALKEYAKFFDTHLFIPWGLWDDKRLLQASLGFLAELRNTGVKLGGYSNLSRIFYKLGEIANSRRVLENLAITIPGSVQMKVNTAQYEVVISLHEDWGAVHAGGVLAEYFNARSMVLLQLPPFYGSRKRLSNILKASLLWRKSISSSPLEEVMFESEAIVRYSLIGYLRSSRLENRLRKYDLVLCVSKAIPVEMGNEWLNRAKSLDPGVSLDEKDLEAMQRIKNNVGEKGNYVVFGGRATADKGLIEALITFKYISKRFPDLKLVITGNMPFPSYLRIKRVCRKLGIGDKVAFTGFVPREKRFEIVAKARLMLYPSHVDSFSYAVLESLYLNTPVVAYKIPAIEIYYGGLPGVELVEEWDLEALTVKAIDILEKGVVAVEPPKIKSWEEIMSEEVGLIYKLVEGM
jgi:glycosyltransferase involved in cell wall biosynthesis